jgi:hypothetical protein
MPHADSLYLNLNQCHFQTIKFKVIPLLVPSPRSLLLSIIDNWGDMEGHVPTTQPIPKELTTGLPQNAAPAPNVGRPGDINGPAAMPHVERGINGRGVGGTSSLPPQGQVPV